VIAFRVTGTAAPQGSKRHVGGGRMIESSKALGPWRERVHAKAVETMVGPPITLPVRLSVRFTFMRPRSHYRSGRFQHLVKPNAPPVMMSQPDLSKLIRAIEDALTGVVYRDDAQIVQLYAEKVYGDIPACDIAVENMEEPAPQRIVEASGGDLIQAAAVSRMVHAR
jgi:Holliday junction resolvase RusA-like endonuclease